MKIPRKQNPKEVFMSRKETSLWLGRSLSTGEVSLQTLMKLVSIIAFQQQMIQALFERLPSRGDGANKPDAFAEMESGATQEILQKLAEIDEQLKPVAQVVDQACAQLEKDIA